MPPTFVSRDLPASGNSSRLDYNTKSHTAREAAEDSDDDEAGDGSHSVEGKILNAISEMSFTTVEQITSLEQVTMYTNIVSSETLIIVLSPTPAVIPSTSTTTPRITPAPTSSHAQSRIIQPTTTAESSILNNLPSETNNVLPGLFIGAVILLLLSCIALIKMRHSKAVYRMRYHVKDFFCGRRKRRNRTRVAQSPGLPGFFDVGGKLGGVPEKPLPVLIATPSMLQNVIDRALPAVPLEGRGQSGSPSTRSVASSLSIAIPPPRPFQQYLLVGTSADPPRVSVSLTTPSLSVPPSPTKSRPQLPPVAVPAMKPKRFTTITAAHAAADSDELSVSEGDLVRVLSSAGSEDKWVLCENGKGNRGFVPREKVAG